MSKPQVATQKPVQLVHLPGLVAQHAGFAAVVESLQSGNSATLDGVWGSSRALVAAALAAEAPGPLVVVCPHQGDIDELVNDLSLFTDDKPERFPAWESERGEQVVYDEIYGDRLRLLKQLQGHSPPPIVVTSIQSLLHPVPTRAALEAQTRLLRTGDLVDLESLARWLVERGFHSTTAVELPGEFSLRGGILDIFAPDWLDPVRIELFGDEIESIRRFEVSSQRSLMSLAMVDLTVLTPGEHDQEHLATYLPPSSWLLLIEPSELQEEGQHYLQRLDRPQDFHSIPAVLAELYKFPSVTAEAISASSLDKTCHLQIESVERFSGDISRVRDELDAVGSGQHIYVVCETEAEAQRLNELFGESKLAQQGRLHYPIGHLHQGFRLVKDGLALISGGELFHRADLVRPTVRRRLGRVIDSFLELRKGDLVVHLAHGVGRYRGLKLLEKDGQAEEHLELEYHGGTKIYVPSSKIELVQKYVGGTRGKAPLSKIGGRAWERQKEAAEQAVTDLAVEMLDIQAARSARPGIRFPADTAWQQEFDAAFPYQETPDQLSAIRAIKGDMQSPTPMDRLLCGDVGYGKTEVAIRAAFKAVDAGYQVAVLVPTTVLAEQHYRTFTSRMAAFPFQIARLSRFCTDKEQSQVLAGLRSGSIDIVIGTHRLAQHDVQFQNLGLLVIDEEQRFGVAVKERLKALRATVDILTMTATPIPRTLHLSLLGVRDISNLETPPADRIAVETRISRFDPELVRHAVMRELNRDGQIYFVHNRVHDIEKVAQKLQEIVPEARIGIGHGQMPVSELEDVMLRFVRREFDLLLATTIIESGLDIPNANTIFIDDADRYGLADLHQLRGRVGRYKHRAYCYLLVDPKRHLTPDAARRLRAIEEFSEMGAGFAIAMRDLELRGAGNILGPQQSGHIAAVGYELYCALLEKAVRAQRNLPPKETIEVDVNLPIEAYLPRQYVPDLRLKIDLYRRLARIATETELADFRSELVDRFGSPPAEVERLLELAELRIWAHRWQIHSIHLENEYAVFQYSHRKRIEQLAASVRGKLRVVDDKSAYLPLGKEVIAIEEKLSQIKSVLRPPG